MNCISELAEAEEGEYWFEVVRGFFGCDDGRFLGCSLFGPAPFWVPGPFDPLHSRAPFFYPFFIPFFLLKLI